jgi:heme oxygenase (biliverdin-IX-beta and delta-forming)
MQRGRVCISTCRWNRADRVRSRSLPSWRGAIPEAASLPARLRAETTDAHRSIERTLDLSWMLSSLDTYRRTLAAYYGFFAVVEPRLEAMLPHSDFYPVRRKLPFLRTDLRGLGLTEAEITRLPRCAGSLTVSSRAEALGILYVFEGATLGGAIIGRAATQRLGAETPTNYFNAYGSLRGRMWAKLRALLSEATGPQDDQAVEAAKLCFAALEGWLAEARLTGGPRPLDPPAPQQTVGRRGRA